MYSSNMRKMEDFQVSLIKVDPGFRALQRVRRIT
jgi:hypothetical protein